MRLFSGTANLDLSKKIAHHLNKPLSDINISNFPDGETKIIINESVRKQDCYIIQPTGPSEQNSVNDNIMELCILCDALKRGSANSVNIVMPYYGYQRQDRKDYSRAPITAKVVASFLETMDADRIIVVDLHAGQIQGFFSNKTPFDNIYIESVFTDYITKNIGIKNSIVISPDIGGMKRAVRIANKLGIETGAIFKERKHNNIEMVLYGDVKNKNVIIVDDILDTATTACSACDILKQNGCCDIFMIACHGIFSGNALENIKNSGFKKIAVTNTLCQERHSTKITRYQMEHIIDIIDISKMCSEAIRSSYYGHPLTFNIR